jgi:DNA-binding LacI/PurR family transcriptional regulator
LNEIAREVKRSPATVSRVLKGLKISKAITIAKAGKILNEKLDAAQQLKKINKKANEILDRTDPASPEVVLKAMAEIRGQLKLQLEIFQALYNVEEVAKWQNEVMDILGEVAPDVRDRFYQRLHERRPF